MSIRVARRRGLIVLVTAILVSAGTARPARSAGEAAVVSSDDAYHYALWKDGRHDLSYTEWWYFNLFDAGAGVRAIFSYFVTDPDDLLGAARVQMVAVAYTPDGIVAAEVHPRAAFSASAERADVTIAGNAVRALDPDTYRVTGASVDGRLAWDLRFRPTASGTGRSARHRGWPSRSAISSANRSASSPSTSTGSGPSSPATSTPCGTSAGRGTRRTAASTPPRRA